MEKKTIEVSREGVIAVGEVMLPAFQLQDGRRAVAANNFYNLIRNKNVKRDARVFLATSKIKVYLSPAISQEFDWVANGNGKEIPLLFSEEVVSVCRAILRASFDNNLGSNWQSALRPAQLLLMLFAQDGVDEAIDIAIVNQPVMTKLQFRNIVARLLVENKVEQTE